MPVSTVASTALAKLSAEVRRAGPAEGVLGVDPAFVVLPGTVGEAAEAMRTAAEHGLTVVPRGGETRLDWGAAPRSCDLLLDTTGLDRILEHAAGDLIVRTEAGVQMASLADALAEQRQRLALESPLPGSTVGGTLATAACGPRRLLYGSPRDLLIGITVVRADGTVARSGGKVVKNVAGYDLGKLFAGSFGTLGLIVEATFRLHPVPAAETYLTREYASVTEAVAAARRVAHSPAVPAAIELDVPATGPVTLATLLEGVPGALPSRAEAVAALLDGALAAPAPPQWWSGYPDGTTLIATVCDEPAASVVALIGELGGHLRWSASRHGHVALPAGVAAAQVRAVLAGLRGIGTAAVRYAPEQVREQIDLWGPIGALGLMRRIKEQFDPDDRLSPGRFVIP